MDALLFTIFAQTIAVNNTKVGLFGDQRYIVLGFFSAVAYLLFHFLGYLGKSKASLYGKFTILLIFILVTVIGVGNSYLNLRDGSGTNSGLSDAGMQSELSGRLLLLGQNPYSTDYFKTDLVNVPYQDAENNRVNPALYYYVYPPMIPIISAISYKLIAPRMHWFDIRVVYIGFLLVLLTLGYFKWGIHPTYFLYLIAIGVNPDFVRTLLEGANDIVAITFFLAAVMLIEKKKYWIIAAVLYAMSIGSKQIIWSTVPFMIIGLWREYGFQYMWKFMLLAGASTLCIFLPFMVWDYKMFFAGLVGFHAGTVPHSYPIHNFGFGKMLVQLGIVKNIYAYYNFALWQFGGLAVLGVVMSRIFKAINTTTFILMGWTGSMMILFLFNRAMNFSYLGIMQVAVAITICFAYPKISDSMTPVKSSKKSDYGKPSTGSGDKIIK